MADRFARLKVPTSTASMEAKRVAEIPDGESWQFEPKWDGFRCLAFRDGDGVELMSRSGKPLGRYFPEVVETLVSLAADLFVLDGELILPLGGVLSFDALQMRLHPAASRIARLSRETPAQLMLFDCLQIGSGLLINRPLRERREALEAFHRDHGRPDLLLSPMTCVRAVAERWLDESGGALDGIVAKRRDEPYRPGERAMFKHKLMRTADCVVGGFRYDSARTRTASLLLGLHGDDGRLYHVGFTSALPEKEMARITPRLEALRGPSAFDGSAPGGESRWSRGKSAKWEPLRPELVAEVGYDQVTGDRFRHGTTFLRWRPDKAPSDCRMDQLAPELEPARVAQVLRTGSADRP